MDGACKPISPMSSGSANCTHLWNLLHRWWLGNPPHRGTFCDFVDELGQQFGGNSRRLITFVKDRPGHDRCHAIAAAKMRDGLGWRPKHTFETGICETVEWYLPPGLPVKICLRFSIVSRCPFHSWGWDKAGFFHGKSANFYYTNQSINHDRRRILSRTGISA